MKLSNIKIFLVDEKFPPTYQWDFSLRMRFIGNYLSREVGKLKYQTDSATLSIYYGDEFAKKDDFFGNFQVGLPFDKDSYERAARTDDFRYYCELYRKGIMKGGENFNIPTEKILLILDSFEKGGYINKIKYKSSKIIREKDIKATFYCDFGTDAFSLIGHFDKISTKEELCSGVILRTVPNETTFFMAWDDIVTKGDQIHLMERYSDNYLVTIDLNQILRKQFNFKFYDIEEIADASRRESLEQSINLVTFNGNSFYYGVTESDTDEFDEYEDRIDNMNRNV